MDLLKKLCTIHAPAGNEVKLKEFILDYVKSNMHCWEQIPEIYCGKGFQDCIVLGLIDIF